MTRSTSIFYGRDLWDLFCSRRHLVNIIFEYFVLSRRRWNITPRLWATTQSSEGESSLRSFTSGTNGLIESFQVNILTSDELVLVNGFPLQEQQAGSSSGKWRWISRCLLCLTTLHSMWASTSYLVLNSRNLWVNWNRNYFQQFSQLQRSGCLRRRWIFGETL